MQLQFENEYGNNSLFLETIDKTNRVLQISQMMIANANAERNRGRTKEAITLYKRTIDLLPVNCQSIVKLIAIRELAFCYLLDGDIESSLVFEQRLLEMLNCADEDISDQTIVEQKLLSLAKVSALYVILKKFDKASLHLESFLKLVPENEGTSKVFALNLLASVKHSAGQSKKAEELYRKALEILETQEVIDQNYIDCLKGLGISLCSQGKENHGRLFCRVAVTEMKKQNNDNVYANELAHVVQPLCNQGQFGYVKPICDDSQRIAIVQESNDLIGRFNSYARIVKQLVPSFRVDEIDLRIENRLARI